MPIKNLSDVRRLPRLGKIHLGIKQKSDRTGNEYPKEVDYFVVPDKISSVFGEKPKELRIMFPVEAEQVFFPQFYKCYGSGALLKCKGDGETAWTWDEDKGGLKEIPCPCEKLEAGDCKQVGILQFLIPEVEGAGVWQITTSSRNSIIDINSGIDFVRGLCGRIRMIPIVLKRSPIETQRIEDGKPKRTTHYTLQIDLPGMTIKKLQEAGAIAPERVLLPPPDESKDELLYPVNGFEKEADVVDAEPSDDPCMDLRVQLNDVISKYKKAGGNVKNREQARLAELSKPEEFKRAIDFYQGGLDDLQSKSK